MRRMRTAATLLAPLAFVATAAPATSPSVTHGIAFARIGESVRIEGLRVTPLRVLEDSRCPQNARCITAGRVRLSVRLGGTTREMILGQPVRVSGGALWLATVLPPAALRDRPLPPRAYRFGFRFQPLDRMQLIRD